MWPSTWVERRGRASPLKFTPNPPQRAAASDFCRMAVGTKERPRTKTCMGDRRSPLLLFPHCTASCLCSWTCCTPRHCGLGTRSQVGLVVLRLWVPHGFTRSLRQMTWAISAIRRTTEFPPRPVVPQHRHSLLRPQSGGVSVSSCSFLPRLASSLRPFAPCSSCGFFVCPPPGSSRVAAPPAGGYTLSCLWYGGCRRAGWVHGLLAVSCPPSLADLLWLPE